MTDLSPQPAGSLLDLRKQVHAHIRRQAYDAARRGQHPTLEAYQAFVTDLATACLQEMPDTTDWSTDTVTEQATLTAQYLAPWAWDNLRPAAEEPAATGSPLRGSRHLTIRERDLDPLIRLLRAIPAADLDDQQHRLVRHILATLQTQGKRS